MTPNKQRNIRLFLLGALLGFAAFLCLYGVSALDVTNDAFLRGGYIEQDVQQHYAGWLFYRQSPLSLPLCETDHLNWPDGTSIAFTDSIPLFAAFFRVLSPLLTGTFQYFGLYTALCFALQGGFAALLVGLFSRSDLAALLGAVPFVFSPILLERAFRHTSLAAHFLILAALYYYVLGMRENRFAFKGLFVVNALAIALHPYFVPMTYAITFALAAGQAWRSRRVLRPVAFLFGNLAATVCVGWLFGVFSSNGSGAGGAGNEYGYFSMNLNALWNPTSRGVVWSLFLPVQNQTGGNYDGFNYLGLGVLLGAAVVAAWGAWTLRARVLTLARRHGWLLFVCVCLTAFAVSHVVTANGATLFRFPLPQVLVKLATTLRSSGRLFWPVYYLIMLAAVAGLLRLCSALRPKHAGVAALACLCIVQLADLSPALAQKAVSLREYSPTETDSVTGTTPSLCVSTDFFEAVSGRYNTLVALDPLTHTGMELALYAADEGMNSTDTAVVARYDEAAAQARRTGFINEVLSGGLQADCLYVTERPETFLQLADAAAEQGAWCGALYARVGDGAPEPVVYVIAPGLAGYSHELAVPYGEDFPLRVADHSDDYWFEGVLSTNLEDIGREADENRVVLFYDTPLARRRLTQGKAILCEGQHYPILDVDDSDEGWLIVTLETADARSLVGKDLVIQ